MKENTNLDINTIKLLYRKYREHLVYYLIISVTIVLFFSAILPRTQDLARLNNDRKIELNKLSVLNKNFALLSGLDDSSLNSQLLIVSSALPMEKDFEGVLNAISQASEKSGAGLSDYEFQVGNLLQSLSIETTGFPFLTLSVNIKGTPSQVVKFVGNLSKSTPLSEITSITAGTNNATVAIVFYYKSLPPIQFNDSKEIAPISDKGKETISTLSSWGAAGRLPQPQAPIPSTSSAIPF